MKTSLSTGWRRPSTRLAGVIGMAFALVTGGCTGTGRNDAPDTSGGAEVQEARFVATDYSYPVAPAQLEEGLVHVSAENHGTVGHEFTLTGIGDASALDVLEDFRGTGLSGEPFPPYVDQAAVPPFVSVSPGEADEATMTLSEGHYILWCTITDVAEGDRSRPHFKLGMIREIEVVASDKTLVLPEADGTITARDYSYDVDLEAGDRTVNFVNEGPDQIHLATIEVYPEGVTEEEAREAFEEKRDGPSGVGFSGIFSTGLGAQIVLPADALQSGRTYLFQCFVPDREGGKPHVTSYDMFSIVTIE
ncbi:MAG TPA: hypothetical protein VF028_02705 [Actinomycetota bacterium]|jgi:hypothetical protein|nr:hypothetical protein [Actinomycetota bacterium]